VSAFLKTVIRHIDDFINGTNSLNTIVDTVGNITLSDFLKIGGDITLTGKGKWDEVNLTVADPDASVTLKSNSVLSTRNISGTDYLNGVSKGASGNIEINGSDVDIQPGVQLLAQTESGSHFDGGSVSVLGTSNDV